MKKFFLLFGAALFLGSCSDLALKEEDAVKKELPADFDWKVYAEINNDVKMSQVIFQIREEKGESDTSAAMRANCANLLLEDLNFAEKIYTDYTGCPSKGWDIYRACTGEYANNSNYNDPTGYDRTSLIPSYNNIKPKPHCYIGSCWHGGWEEIGDLKDDFENINIDLLSSESSKCVGDYLYENKLKCRSLGKAIDSIKVLNNYLDSLLKNAPPDDKDLESIDVDLLLDESSKCVAEYLRLNTRRCRSVENTKNLINLTNDSINATSAINAAILAEPEKYILKSVLQDSLGNYKNNSWPRETAPLSFARRTIAMMCSFVPVAADVATATSRLEDLASNSNLDPTLIEQHYFLIGRDDGRPYKYCDCSKQGQCLEERNEEAHAIKLVISGKTYYDYSQHTFCMNKSDYKIYLAD